MPVAAVAEVPQVATVAARYDAPQIAAAAISFSMSVVPAVILIGGAVGVWRLLSAVGRWTWRRFAADEEDTSLDWTRGAPPSVDDGEMMSAGAKGTVSVLSFLAGVMLLARKDKA